MYLDAYDKLGLQNPNEFMLEALEHPIRREWDFMEARYRRTGRTTRKLVQAALGVMEGEQVVFLVCAPYMADEVLRTLLEFLGKLDPDSVYSKNNRHRYLSLVSDGECEVVFRVVVCHARTTAKMALRGHDYTMLLNDQA